MKKISTLFVAGLLGLTTTEALAGGADLPPQNPWLITGDAYIWAINMKGHTIVDNQRANVSQTFGDILKHMKAGGMLWLSATKGAFGLFFNGMFSVLRTSETTDGITITARNTFSILASGLSYRLYRNIINQSNLGINSSFSIVPYAGARYTLNNVSISAAGTKFTSDEHFTQPIVGSRFIYQFRKNWSLTFAGDVGYAGQSNKSYNLIGLIGYNNLFGVDILSLNLGYRFLHQYYQTDGTAFTWDMNLFGPVFGLSLTI